MQQLKELRDLSSLNRHLIILNEHKSHITLNVIQKASEHGINIFSLPSHICHVLLPLSVVSRLLLRLIGTNGWP